MCLYFKELIYYLIEFAEILLVVIVAVIVALLGCLRSQSDLNVVRILQLIKLDLAIHRKV
jgi:hypothetical protein